MTETLHATQRDAEFRRLVLQSIAEGLSSIFSESVSKATFSLMETRFGIKREELPERIHDFENHLTMFFGLGAPVLIRVFVRNLCAKLEIPYRQGVGCNFELYVKDCMRRWREKEGVRGGGA